MMNYCTCICFCSCHFFLLSHEYKTILYPVYAATVSPVTFYAMAQFIRKDAANIHRLKGGEFILLLQE